MFVQYYTTAETTPRNKTRQSERRYYSLNILLVLDLRTNSCIAAAFQSTLGHVPTKLEPFWTLEQILQAELLYNLFYNKSTVLAG